MSFHTHLALSKPGRCWLVSLTVGLSSHAFTAEAQTAPADIAYASCGFVYAPRDSYSQELESLAASAVTCADPRFGAINRQALVNGTQLGVYVGIDWNPNPPTQVPPDGYGGTARASLNDVFTVPGNGWGTMTLSLQVRGSLANSAYFSFLTSLLLQAGDSYAGPSDGSNFWRRDYSSNGTVNEAIHVPLAMPLGEPFVFYTALYIWGGSADGAGANYTDGLADFLNTVEPTITRLQDAGGNDIPLSNLQVASGRNFTDTPPIPEPATYAMMLIGLGLVGLRLRHRHLRGV